MMHCLMNFETVLQLMQMHAHLYIEFTISIAIMNDGHDAYDYSSVDMTVTFQTSVLQRRLLGHGCLSKSDGGPCI